MPAFVDIVVVVQDNETLNLGCREKAPDRGATLPSQGAQPADHKGQEFLLAPRRELGYPMVLTTCKREERLWSVNSRLRPGLIVRE